MPKICTLFCVVPIKSLIYFKPLVIIILIMNSSYIAQISISMNSMRMSLSIHKLTLTNRKLCVLISSKVIPTHLQADHARVHTTPSVHIIDQSRSSRHAGSQLKAHVYDFKLLPWPTCVTPGGTLGPRAACKTYTPPSPHVSERSSVSVDRRVSRLGLVVGKALGW